MLRLNLFLSVEEALREGEVSGSLAGKELDVLRLAWQAGHHRRRDPVLAGQESRGCWSEGLQDLTLCQGSLADPAPLTAATDAAATLLRLSVEFFSVRGLAGLHSGGGAEGLRGDLGLEHSLGEIDQSDHSIGNIEILTKLKARLSI